MLETKEVLLAEDLLPQDAELEVEEVEEGVECCEEQEEEEVPKEEPEANPFPVWAMFGRSAILPTSSCPGVDPSIPTHPDPVSSTLMG